MQKKNNDKSSIVNEPAIAYKKTVRKLNIDPNVPFEATQEEFIAYIKEIEKGPFYPVEETFQRVRQWIESHKE